MKIFRSLEAIPPFPRKTALAVGNFDGLHLGHRKILRFLVKKSREQELLSGVLTFSPHPEKIFGPKKLCMIQTLEQRLEGFAALGVDLAVVAPFNRAFAGLSDKDFVQKILAEKLQARAVVVGAGFRFGKDRKGDIPALEKFGRKFGLQVSSILPVKKKGSIVSSSLIRDLLQKGRLGFANNLLGRPYGIEGDIVRGDARGRKLGYPTANVQTPNEIIPRGVFITLLDLEGRQWPSLTNVGFRPTFGFGPRFELAAARPTKKSGTCHAGEETRGCERSSRPRISVETHILDFHKNIYGASANIVFLRKIREERTFAGAEELTARIKKDLKVARNFFKNREAHRP